MNLLIKIWKDPVLSKLIASALLCVFTWALDLWPVVVRVFNFFISLLNIDINIPVWFLIIIVPVLLTAIPILSKIKRTPKDTEKPDFIKYKSDNILGIKWIWEYIEPDAFNDKYSITTPIPRCPTCNSQLEINDYNHPLVKCINDECDWTWQQKGHFNTWINHSSELRKKVGVVIDRKIHNREY